VRARSLTGFLFLSLVLALGGATASAVAHEPEVTEFQTGLTVNSGPWGIVEGPGDKLWFTENSLSALGSFGLDTGVFGELSGLSIVGDARGIAEGPDGNLWVTEAAAGGRVARITPSGTVTEFPAHEDPMLATYPVDITAGPDGNLWFVSQSPEFVGRITPAGVVATFSVGLTPNSDLSSITVGPDGNLWFTQSADPGRIGRITTAGVITEYSAGLAPNMAPSDITAGPDGKLWFTERADPGGIGRISTEGVITEFRDGLTENSGPRSIALGSDDALWFTESASPGAIGRITASGAITEHTLGLTPGGSPWYITPGPDGNMWFTGNANPGLIGRITVPPAVKTQPGHLVDDTTASLKVKIRPNAQDTSFYFDYGQTPELGSQSATLSAGSGWDTDYFSAEVGDLARGATYYYRAVATNSAGTTLGEIRSLKTKSVTSGEDTLKEKQPEFARRVVAAAKDGTIRFKPPGGRWRRLPVSGAEIPVGATVDAREGGIELTSVGRQGGLQTGRFGAGVFSVHQPAAARGRVDLRLRGGDFSGCRRAARRTARGGSLAGASMVARVRRLWGRDGGGRFRTFGRHSHATVRGTRWLTVDRCSGTFTRVTQGAVVVRDTVRRRSVLVRAGHSYLARRPRR
jgi:virginiamycin B lyase